jgi:hypothetical protein
LKTEVGGRAGFPRNGPEVPVKTVKLGNVTLTADNAAAPAPALQAIVQKRMIPPALFGETAGILSPRTHFLTPASLETNDFKFIIG